MLDKKVIVITGGAGLLGQVFVKGVMQQGATVVIADLNQEIALQQMELLQAESVGAVAFVQMNICDKKSISQAIESITTQFGKIDALVNNAYPRNANYGRPLMDVEYEDFCDNTNLHLGGYFLTSQQFCKHFLEQGYGNIVNIASIYGVVAPKFELYKDTSMTMPVEYAVIKSGVIHLTKYFAKSFKGKNIRVNCLSPGGILDAQPTPFLQAYKAACINKGMLDKNDILGSLLYLLSDMSQYLNGHNLIVDDGFTL